MRIGNDTTKIYTVFATRGYGGPGGGSKSPITNEDLLQKLEGECDGVSFVAGNANLSELDSQKESLDGVLIIGTFREYGLAFTGLPTIVVYNLHEFMNMPYKLFYTGKEEESILVGGQEYTGGRILTASLDRLNCCSAGISSAMLADLVAKIKLIQVIKKLKESRILVVTPHRYLAQVDYQGDAQKHFPECIITNCLRILGYY